MNARVLGFGLVDPLLSPPSKTRLVQETASLVLFQRPAFHFLYEATDPNESSLWLIAKRIRVMACCFCEK